MCSSRESEDLPMTPSAWPREQGSGAKFFVVTTNCNHSLLGGFVALPTFVGLNNGELSCFIKTQG